MQTGYTGYIDRTEWRWTSLVSLTFVLVAFVPFVLVALFSPNRSEIEFMGAIHDHKDAAASIARMQQGANGQVLLDFLYSSQEQETALVHPVYPILGQLVRFTQLSPVIMFHILRIFVSLFMYLTIYHLGSNIWVKVRTRRIFFILASASAGFGWIVAFLFANNNNTSIPDLTLPQAFPLYASAVNIHYPLAIACVALIASVVIPILRPGETSEPSAENGGIVVFVASLILALVYPDALMPLGIAYILNVAANWIIQGKANTREWYWGLWILVPALPIVTYDILTVIRNPFVAAWLAQRGLNTPSLWILIISFGLPFLIAIPALIRAIRKFEPDGDRFMLFWLLAMIITMYLPIQLNQYLLLGAMIPIGYFATRAIEDYWFEHIRRIYRPRVYIVVIPILVISHLVWMFLPVYPILSGWRGYSPSILESEYGVALRWLDASVDEGSIILASPSASLWIPAWTGNYVVYGHPSETYDAEETRIAVENWYAEENADVDVCLSFIEAYGVDFVIYGQREQNIGSGACIENLTEIETFGSLSIYSTQATEQ